MWFVSALRRWKDRRKLNKRVHQAEARIQRILAEIGKFEVRIQTWIRDNWPQIEKKNPEKVREYRSLAAERREHEMELLRAQVELKKARREARCAA